MDLRDAYRVLDVASGATEDVVRDARKTLSKVWHPDRYANDPAMQAKAEAKLRDVNEAFEVVRRAGFPASAAAAAPAPARAPTPAATPVPLPTPAPSAPNSRAGAEPAIELVPRRRVRWPVVIAMFAALAIGAYFAVIRLGSDAPATPPVAQDPATSTSTSTSTSTDPHPVAPPDAAAVAVASPDADAAPAPVLVPDLPRAPPPGATYTLGASKAQVLALQGEPNGTEASSSYDSHTVNGDNVTTSISRTKLRFGHSEVDLIDDQVVGWWDNDVRLRVAVAPRDPSVVAAARARGTLAIGQTADDVLGVLGMPTRVTARRWSYGSSEIEADDRNRVVAVTRGDVDLHVQ